MVVMSSLWLDDETFQLESGVILTGIELLNYLKERGENIDIKKDQKYFRRFILRNYMAQK